MFIFPHTTQTRKWPFSQLPVQFHKEGQLADYILRTAAAVLFAHWEREKTFQHQFVFLILAKQSSTGHRNGPISVAISDASFLSPFFLISSLPPAANRGGQSIPQQCFQSIPHTWHPPTAQRRYRTWVLLTALLILGRIAGKLNLHVERRSSSFPPLTKEVANSPLEKLADRPLETLGDGMNARTKVGDRSAR